MKLNMTYISWTVIINALSLNGVINGYYISLQSNHSSWSRAAQTCRSKAGTLANYKQVTEAVKKCSNHMKEFGAIWTSNIYIQTPLISIVGCYTSSDRVFRLREHCSSCKSIPSCFYHCRTFAYFGISGTQCFCLSNLTDHIDSQRQKASLCQKQFPEKYMIIYRRSKSTFVYTDLLDLSYNVLYNLAECRHSSPPNTLHMKFSTNDDGKEHYPVCQSQVNTNESNVSIIKNAFSDWEQANDACIRSTEDYLFDEILSTDDNKTCYHLNASLGNSTFLEIGRFWSAQRTYKAAYSLNEYLKTNLSLNNITCTVANTSNITMPIDQPCSEGSHGFFCVTDKSFASVCHLEVKKAKFSVILPLIVVITGVTFVSIVGFIFRRWSYRCRSERKERREESPEETQYDDIELDDTDEFSAVEDSEDENHYNHTSSYLQYMNDENA